jgi:hypothetical protein
MTLSRKKGKTIKTSSLRKSLEAKKEEGLLWNPPLPQCAPNLVFTPNRSLGSGRPDLNTNNKYPCVGK